MTPDVTLTVNGREFAGWERVNVTRRIDTLSGAFALSVSDRWEGQSAPWQIVEGDECVLSIDGAPLITGYVDRRSVNYAANSHTLEVSGRDRTADLVDCSVLLDVWEFAAQPVDRIIAKLAAPFGISVRLAPGTSLAVPRGKFAINPGDTVFATIDRLCRVAGVLAMSDGRGGLLLTRASSDRANTALIEGQNIKAAVGNFDISQRYARYVVTGQSAGTDDYSGEAAAHVQAEARDSNVRAGRVLVIRADANMTLARAKEQATWEATVRAGRTSSAVITVQDWRQADGTLWPLNALVPLTAPRLGIDREMLIVGTEMSLDDAAGTLTTIELARPEAYIPQPVGKDPWSVDEESVY